MRSIQFDNIWKDFKIGMKRTTVLHGLSLGINSGEIFGFLGPNGAGKSTAIKLLLNFIKPTRGTITLEQLVVGQDSFQHLIGYSPETPCFYENLTGRETLLFAGKASGMGREAVKERAEDVLRRMDLSAAGSWPIKTYSKGMKQRLGLAVALVHEPRVYILDEPMSGLDPLGRRLISDVILELREKGKTVFFSSHILSDVERLCDRIGVLNKGELLYSGEVEAFSRNAATFEDAFINLIEGHERGKNV
jgi:ABC-2 type transport system ATP-binding protein